MKCMICETRKPRRQCPGVNGDICSICCGAEREVSINCPLDCTFLAEARLHEKFPEVPRDQVPNLDVPLNEKFLRDHEPIMLFLGAELLAASLETSGAVDSDVREALDSLIRTYRTLQSGLYYETRPNNPLASAIHQKIQAAIEELRKKMSEKGAPSVRDAEILGMLVFFERIGLSRNNGRPKGRSFIDHLRAHFPKKQEAAAATPSLIQV